MRRPLAAAALLAVALLVSACAAAQAPGWTYAPPTPAPTAGPSGSAGASAEASAGSSAATSAAPSGQSAAPSGGSAAPSGSSGGSGGGAGASIDLVALNIAFDKTALTAPANAAFTIHFDNQDASVPHNVTIKDSTGADVFKPDTITGPAKTDYSVPALKPGTYTFYCVVHPNMTGTLTVGP